MMRPVSVAMPPNKPDGLAYSINGTGANRTLTLTWNDNSITETAFVVQRTTNGATWTDIGTVQSPLGTPNIHGTRSSMSTVNINTAYLYRVVAQNTVGYGAEFPTMTVQSVSDTLGVNPPAAPTTLTATLTTGSQITLSWRDNATNETNFVIQRSTDGVNFSQIATAPARNNTGTVNFNDTTILPGGNYTYRVAAVNVAGTSAFSNTSAAVVVPAMPALPTSFTAANGTNGTGNSRTVILTWTANTTNVTGFTIQRATNAAFTSGLNTVAVGANVTTLTQTGLSRNTLYYYRIRANNGTIIFSGWVSTSIRTNP